MLDQRTIDRPSPGVELFDEMVSKRKHELGHFETEIAADAQALAVSLEKTFGGIEYVVAFYIFLQNIHHDVC